MANRRKTNWSTRWQNFAFLRRICLRKPAFLARLVNGFFQARVLKRMRFRFMDIALDYACNMRCQHCSAHDLKRRDVPKLSVEEYERIADVLCREGCLIFHFTGGEPLLRRDLEEVIRAFKPHRCGISIQSNGLLASRRRLLSLQRAGADIFNVSIDSGVPEEHDAFRRCPGAFEKALAAVDTAIDLGYSTSVSTCISHTSLRSEGLRRIIEFTESRGIWCYFNLAVPAGNWRDCEEFLLTPEDQKEVRRLLRETPHCRIDWHSNWYRVGCGTIKEKAYLTAYGDVMPCPFIQISLGNLREENMGAIRRRALRIPEFREYYPGCLAAEVRSFIEKTPCYSGDAGQLPVSYRDVDWMAAVMCDSSPGEPVAARPPETKEAAVRRPAA